MPNNALIKRFHAHFDAGMDIGESYGKQIASDLIIIALHRVYGFGYERTERLIAEVDKLYERYKKNIGNVKNPECDAYRQEIDTLLQECVPAEKFKPFEERYEGIEKVRY